MDYKKSFQEIIKEFQFTKKNLQSKTSFYHLIISKGRKTPSVGNFYDYLNLKEVEDLNKKLVFEVERKYTLELIAAFEAKLVYYFNYQVKKKLKRKHPLYKAYNNIITSKNPTYLMFSHFIDIFKQEIHTQDRITYTNIKYLIEYRNWLAHGRGWEKESYFDRFDIQYSHETIMKVISFLPHFPKS